MSKQRIWFITGISRGLGKALAQTVLAAGDAVIGTTRSGKASWGQDEQQLTVMPLELTDAEAIRKTVAEAYAVHGRLDVVLNNAGYGLLGAIEEASAEETEHVLAVNFHGPLAVITAVLPFLRRQRCGHIVNVSSIAGLADGRFRAVCRGEVRAGRRFGGAGTGSVPARHQGHAGRTGRFPYRLPVFRFHPPQRRPDWGLRPDRRQERRLSSHHRGQTGR